MSDINPIKYEVANSITKKMLKAGLITQEEYDRIDVLNKEKYTFASDESASIAKAVAETNAEKEVKKDAHEVQQSGSSVAYKNEDQTSIRALASELGRHPTKFHDWIKKHNYPVEKVKSTDIMNRGQIISIISNENADEIRRLFECVSLKAKKVQDKLDGYFYLIQLKPLTDSNIIKLGYTKNLVEKLKLLQFSAPESKILKTWECKKLWEKTIIDIVTLDEIKHDKEYL